MTTNDNHHLFLRWSAHPILGGVFPQTATTILLAMEALCWLWGANLPLFINHWISLDCRRYFSSRSRRAFEHYYFWKLGWSSAQGPGDRWRAEELLAVRPRFWFVIWLIWGHSSFDYAGECLGQHAGSQQAANLGDNNGICMWTMSFSIANTKSTTISERNRWNSVWLQWSATRYLYRDNTRWWSFSLLDTKRSRRKQWCYLHGFLIRTTSDWYAQSVRHPSSSLKVA